MWVFAQRPKAAEEYQNTYVVAVGKHADYSSRQNVIKRSFKRKAGIEQPADYNTDEQGTVHFFRNQRQNDGYHRRQQRPNRSVQLRHVLFLVCCESQKRTAGYKQHYHGHDPRNFPFDVLHK